MVAAKEEKHSKFITTRIIALGFILIILAGTLLLSLPICNNSSTTIIDSLFTATSATCVTGLITKVPVEQYTFLGQLVILLLIQIGGLGFMVFISMLYLLIKKKFTLKNQILLGASIGSNKLKDLGNITKRILLYTFVFEFLGACILAIRFIPMYGKGIGIWNAIFISISSFCNAGFDILGANSLAIFKTDPLVLIVIAILIICGGLGFLVINEIVELFKRKQVEKFSFKKYINKLSVTAKLVLLMSIILIILGTALVYIFEYNNVNTIGNNTIGEKILASNFLSVSSRTAGMSTFSMDDLMPITRAVICTLMLIGAAPGSTGGGIKITTVAILLVLVKSVIAEDKNVTVFNKEINKTVIYKAISVLILCILCVYVSIFTLMVIEPKMGASVAIFNVISAFSNTGLGSGNISIISNGAKLILILLMLIGRVSTVTMAMAISDKNDRIKDFIRYPEEDVMIG